MTTGVWYTFRVIARNSVGYSDYSDPITILAAQIPDQPEAPTTSIVPVSFLNDNLRIEWLAPNNRGYHITSYIIKIRTSDGVSFTEDVVDCDGTDPVVMAC